MSSDGRNFVLVFPELRWSAGDPYQKRTGTTNTVWDGKDSDLVQLHKDVIQRIKQASGIDFEISYVSMTGHSAGGAALYHASRRPSISNNALIQIGVVKISFPLCLIIFTLGCIT